MAIIFRDRRDAGRRLAEILRPLATQDGLLVLGLPRGGVPVAYEVARALDAPLEVFMVRKLGVPGHEEVAMGAIATGGVRVLDAELIRRLRITPDEVERVTTCERAELARRERAYRGTRPFPELGDRTVIVVDDGFATGASMAAAIAALRLHHPARILAAAPVGSAEACAALNGVADVCVCVQRPFRFRGVGEWYIDFAPTSDTEVRTLLEAASRRRITADVARV
jgi:putative phosphoribosyl transferase